MLQYSEITKYEKKSLKDRESTILGEEKVITLGEEYGNIFWGKDWGQYLHKKMHSQDKLL